MNTTTQDVSPAFSFPRENARFMSSVYGWMTGGVLLTAIVATYLGGHQELIVDMLRNRVLFYGLLIAQFGVVLFLTMAIQRVSAATASAIFLAYSALTGVTISSIFLLYTHDSIASAFLTTAVGFAGLSLFGYVTKVDLGPVGAFCGMALFGLIGWGLLSMFFPSLMGGQAQTAYSLLGLVIFSGLTAYDTQKIKAMNAAGEEGSEISRKAAVFGALILYLDFINMFLSILRLMGDRRR